MHRFAAVVVTAGLLVAGCAGSSAPHTAGPSSVGDDASPDATSAATGSAHGGPHARFSPYHDEYFFAALPTGWRVLDHTANGIDIANPDSTAGVSFSYLYGSAAAAVAGGAATDNDGFADWLLRNQQAENVGITGRTDLGTFTDAIGVTWHFDEREFTAVARGDNVHGVLAIGTAMDQSGGWLGISWQRVARADVYASAAPALAAVSRSITLLKVKVTGGGLRMPATATSTGDVSATQDDVESRLSRDRESATLGYETLVDPTTGDHYDAPLESYDASRGGYFLEKPGGDQPLVPDG